MAERLVVVGGDAAGMSTVSQARRRRTADDLEIVAFERGSFTSYSACGIFYWVGGEVDDRDELIARRPEVFREKLAIDVRLRQEVVAIDTDRRTVTARDLTAGTEHETAYDQLMIATGASPLRPGIPGIGADGVFGIQTLDDGQHVIDALRDRAPRTAVVIGAGYIGLEMAEAMCRRGLTVHVVEAGPRPMATIDVELGDRIADAMRGAGVELHLGVAVTAIEAADDGWVTEVVTEDGALPCDLVVLGTGTRPNSDLGRDGGLPVGSSGGLVVDRRQRTPVDGVWAAGDCAETFHRVSRRPVSFALGTIANKQGRVAGINLGGGYETFPGVLGTTMTRVCGLEIARTGLGGAEAVAAGFEPVTALVNSTTRAHYYPDANELTIKIVAERGSGRLLGAQIVGEEGAAKRIDGFALALWNEMDVGELLNVDLAYAPPFSPVWDPVLIAARKAWQAIEADRAS